MWTGSCPLLLFSAGSDLVVLAFVLCIVCFYFVLIRDWVVAFGFANPLGFGSILSRKGCFLTCSAHSSFWVRLRLCLVPIGVGTSVPFVSLFLPGLLRSAGLKGSDLPSQFARKSFDACCLFRGLLARGSDFVLAVDPFAKIWTLVDLVVALALHIFL
jgi:hypothetical protein